MSAPTHTPGPWEVVAHNWSDTTIYAGDDIIAQISIEDEASEDTQEALEAKAAVNARLIAAAPELLIALQELLICSECADETGYVADFGFMDIDALQSKARAAIAKATGGAPQP